MASTLLFFGPSFHSQVLCPVTHQFQALAAFSSYKVEFEQVCYPSSEAFGPFPVLRQPNGQYVGREDIFDHLREVTGIDNELSAAQKAEAEAFLSLMNEHIHSAFVFHCWVQSRNRSVGPESLKQSLSFPLNRIVAWAEEKKLSLFRFYGSSPDLIYGRAKRAFTLLEDRLGDRQFFFGDSPHSLDAYVYGHLAVCMATHFPDLTLQLSLRAHKKLLDFILRCQTIIGNRHLHPALTTSLSVLSNSSLDSLNDQPSSTPSDPSTSQHVPLSETRVDLKPSAPSLSVNPRTVTALGIGAAALYLFFKFGHTPIRVVLPQQD
eukprot:GILI01016424.1.p1 GENE.GILI01016424.1~~GILI01016424.1.p1  ORF type:complete len:320 (+),score=70.84 GILI01016424.1:29-988(+)